MEVDFPAEFGPSDAKLVLKIVTCAQPLKFEKVMQDVAVESWGMGLFYAADIFAGIARKERRGGYDQSRSD